MLKVYYMLTKPGIIFGNIVTTAAGFVLASQGKIDYWMFLMTLVGLAFIIGSAGVFNNYIDRKIDAKMARTMERPLVKGTITVMNALMFGTLLALFGTAVLLKFTNVLTVLVALTGFFVYLVLYTFWKYRSFYGTLVGSIAGAMPPVVGYCAASDRLDMGAFLLFAILVLWQMPHFFSIAIYRIDEYQEASIPVLPIKRGMYATKVQMVLYIVAFIISTVLLTFAGYTGYMYLIASTIVGVAWLALCMNGFRSLDDARWARQMFACSLAVIMVLCGVIIVDVA